MFSMPWNNPSPIFHAVEYIFPCRGKISRYFSMLWKIRAAIFHGVENGLPLCGKLKIY